MITISAQQAYATLTSLSVVRIKSPPRDLETTLIVVLKLFIVTLCFYFNYLHISYQSIPINQISSNEENNYYLIKSLNASA